jgi:hypothetical protein
VAQAHWPPQSASIPGTLLSIAPAHQRLPVVEAEYHLAVLLLIRSFINMDKKYGP